MQSVRLTVVRLGALPLLGTRRTSAALPQSRLRLYSSVASLSSSTPFTHPLLTLQHRNLRTRSYDSTPRKSLGIPRVSVTASNLPVIKANGSPATKGAVACLSSQQQHDPNKPPPSQQNRIAQGAGFVGAASLLFGKTKYILAALKVTKLASLGSMVVSIGAYSLVFGLPYACGVVGLIFVHECGHAAVMHARGMPFSPMVFLPFMGAVIATKELPRDAWEDALIAAGGPLAGSAGAAVVAVAAHATDQQLLYALADFGFLINLFNLLPIGSMDGGRWAGALSRYVGVAGVGLGGAMAYNGMVSNPLFYLILLSGTYETFQRFWNPGHLPPNFYKISGTQRAVLTGGYFGLVVALLAAMELNQRNKKSPEAIIKERDGELSFDMR